MTIDEALSHIDGLAESAEVKQVLEGLVELAFAARDLCFSATVERLRFEE